MKADNTDREEFQDSQELLKQIEKKKLPVHIAIIMDGNGRWAKRFKKKRSEGHMEGVKSARIIAEC